MQKMENTKLTSTVSVKQYQEFKKNKNRGDIAALLFERLYERYLAPFKKCPARHGFSMMACGCLMMETLLCFQKGRKRTGVAGRVAFEEFFSASKHFNDFLGHGGEFYSNVRCGILHQGETYDGWKIRRNGPLFDKSNKTINATEFLKALEQELSDFTSNLKTSHFHRKPWTGVIRKLDDICKNCNTSNKDTHRLSN